MKYGLKYYFDYTKHNSNNDKGIVDMGWMTSAFIKEIKDYYDLSNSKNNSVYFITENINFAYKYREIYQKHYPENWYSFEVEEYNVNKL